MSLERKVETLTSISGIASWHWNRLANPPGQPFNPFVSHEFLSALEHSGSARIQTGWTPKHLVLHHDNVPIGAVPLYLKTHSLGEYVFDHHWAEAFQRAGGRYYPKLQACVPFTPVTGPRLLMGGDISLTTHLAQALRDLTQSLELSSAHVTFATHSQVDCLTEFGFLQRHDQQFHWCNHNYKDFNAFLDCLSSQKRKNLRRERKEALSEGIEVEWLTGGDISEAHWDHFFEFYMDTGSRKWGSPYLTRKFFSLIGQSMPEHILLIMAKRAGNYIAAALNFIGGETLFGRNWGATEHHPFLHFELCYYQAIDFAIERKLRIVEAGAQGEHKLARGYLPVPTFSAHWFQHPGLRDAVARYLLAERRSVAEAILELNEHSPFKKL